MKIMCAQPDTPLFNWQLRTLLHSALQLGLEREDIVFLMLTQPGADPSPESLKLGSRASVYYYPDLRADQFYHATTKPYLFGCHWAAHPELEVEHVLFLDSDCLLRKIPDLPKNERWFFSDARNYLNGSLAPLLGFPETPAHLLGGLHWYGKGMTAALWAKIEADSLQLYYKLKVERPQENSWVAEMYGWLWNMLERFDCAQHPELAYSNGVDVKRPPIHHQLSDKLFNKKRFKETDPAQAVLAIPEIYTSHEYHQAVRDSIILY